MHTDARQVVQMPWCRGGWRLRHLLIFALCLPLLLIGCKSQPNREALSQYVDPLIGTDWVGNTYPGASVPFGMVQLSPDNGLPGWDRIAGYYYPDSTIAGFSHTHLSGTGAGDLYDVSYMPVLLPAVQAEDPLGIHARFRHETEEARAGYYSVVLEPYDIQVELTATERVGVQRYTFRRASDSACIILNLHKAMNWDKTLSSGLRIEQDTLLIGHRHSDGWARGQQLYFATALSRAPERVQVDSIPLPLDAATTMGGGYGLVARLYYKVAKGEEITLRTALSGVDEEGALGNLRAEAGHSRFDLYRTSATEAWERVLQRVTLQGAADDEKRVFYTALYHSYLCPTIYSDVDGRYLGPDRQIHQLPEGRKHYSTFSLWDTYRSAHPLYNILSRRESADMVRSLIDFGQQNSGHLPVWNMWASETDMMIGYHSVPVIVDAVLRGVYLPSAQEKERITELLRSTAERQGYRGLDAYMRLGYVPADEEGESLSKTLEYAYDDAAIALWAKEVLGNESLYLQYSLRAKAYANLWDAETGYFRPRLSGGAFKPAFDPYAYSEDVTESNAYQYLWSVQHDVEGLAKLMGGPEAMGRRLDEFFSSDTPEHITLPIFSTGMIGQYVQGNEPTHHVLYLYNHARMPWRTAELSREICKSLYLPAPNGLCGNEDCGQMSAWYIFSSLGFYPLDPLTGRYELTSPLFPESQIHLENGKTFTIRAEGLSDKACYIASVTVDGKPYKRSYITHDQILSGSTVVLQMTDRKGVVWYND